MNFEDVNVLVTGGAGFIGFHLAKRLIREGANVCIFDNLSAGSLDILSGFSIESRVGDVRDFDYVKRAVKNQDYVFHLAANASVPESVQNPKYDFETNALGTFNVLEAVRDLNQDTTIVYASSGAVYGEPKILPIPEDHPLNPVSPYGASKASGELLCKVFNSTFGLRTIRIRYFNAYGPLQPRYILHDLLEKLSKNSEELEVLGDGQQTRDWMYITDVIEATLLLATTPSTIGDAFNLGTGKHTTVKELVDSLLSILSLYGKTEVIYTGKSWKGDITKLIPDVSKIVGLGFKPKISLENGLRKLLSYYQQLSIAK